MTLTLDNDISISKLQKMEKKVPLVYLHIKKVRYFGEAKDSFSGIFN